MDAGDAASKPVGRVVKRRVRIRHFRRARPYGPVAQEAAAKAHFDRAPFDGKRNGVSRSAMIVSSLPVYRKISSVLTDLARARATSIVR